MPFAIQGLIGTLAGPEDPGTAFVGFYHDLGEAAGEPGAWGYARGGMGAVTAALRAAAEAAGARSHRRAGERVLVEDGRAGASCSRAGGELRGAVVVSNADPCAPRRWRASSPGRGGVRRARW